MSSIKYDDLDKGLQKKIDSKSGWGRTILIALLSSFFLPIGVMYIKYCAIERPKEIIKLTYDINQPESHPKNEYITDIVIWNRGKKDTGGNCVIFEIEFMGNILYQEWKIPLDSSAIIQEDGGDGHNKYTIRFKDFGQEAKCQILFKSEQDLVRLPILKCNQVLFLPHIKNTLREDL